MPNSRLKVTPRRGWPPLRLSLHLNRPAVTDLQRKTEPKWVGWARPRMGGRKYGVTIRPQAGHRRQNLSRCQLRCRIGRHKR